MIRIHFEFKTRSAEDLEQLNAILAAMPLQELELENTEGYLATTTDGEGNLVGRRYGLDSGTLVCTRAEEEPGLFYQIDSLVADKSVGHKDVMDIWRGSHPERIVRMAVRVGFEEVVGYLILHHQRLDHCA